MTQKDTSGPQTPKAVLRAAIRRETVRNLSDKRVLLDGEWIAQDMLRQRQRAKAWRVLRQSIELLVVFAAIALVGVGFLLISNVII